jgi:AsmA protein
MQLKQLIKISLLSIATIIIVAAILLVSLITVVNPNRFKPVIIKAVYDSTGRILTLNGNISWEFYPNLGLKLHQVTLSNPNGFKTATMLKVDSVNVSVALLPLLTNHIIVKMVLITGSLGL